MDIFPNNRDFTWGRCVTVGLSAAAAVRAVAGLLPPSLRRMPECLLQFVTVIVHC